MCVGVSVRAATVAATAAASATAAAAAAASLRAATASEWPVSAFAAVNSL